MKNLILISSVLIAHLTYSQLSVNILHDTVFCVNPDNANIFSIGGNNVVISNGQAPYIYEWSIEAPYQFPSSSIVLHASDFLNDTTSADPIIVDGIGFIDSMNFYLKVTDQAGNVANDSMRVAISTFAIELEFITWHINAGDTVIYDNASFVYGGLGEKSYLWQPNHGLIDSTFNHLWTSPTASYTGYYCIVTDEFGCSFTTSIIHHVFVETLNISELADKDEFVLYPNPTSGAINFNTFSDEITNIRIFDSKMALIDTIDKNTHNYDLSNFSKGVYFITFEYEGKTQTKKIILN
jgi:hypothetical protein